MQLHGTCAARLYVHVVSRDSCADPGIFVRGGSMPDGQETALTTFFFFLFFYSPQLILQFAEGVQWFYYRGKKLYFSKGPERVQHFLGGGGGPNAYVYTNPYNLLFSRGDPDPLPPSPPSGSAPLRLPFGGQVVGIT